MSIFDKIKDSMGQKTHDGVKNFGESQKQEEAYDTRDRGISPVPLSKIIGSVGRYKDFDSQFRFKNAVPSDRYKHIKKAFQVGKPLPPVKLYQIKDEYYVLDGNHRVAAAKEYHWDTIDAKIVEFISSKNNLRDIIYREKIAFVDETGLPYSIELTEVGQYQRLMDQLIQHQTWLKREKHKEIPIREAAEDWYKYIYQPLVAMINNARLIHAFPERNVSDLYMFISTHQWGKRGRRKFTKEIDKLIPNNMEKFRLQMVERNENDYPDMKREITIFIVFNVEARREARIVEKIFAFDEIIEIHSVHGGFDLIAKAILTRDWISSDAETISYFVQNRIRQIPGVINTQTLIPGFSKLKSTSVEREEY